MARLGLAVLAGVLTPALAAGAELRAGAAADIVQTAGISAAEPAERLFPDGDVRGDFLLTAAPATAVSFSIEALPGPGQGALPVNLGHDAGPTPATDAAGRLLVRFDGAVVPGSETLRIIVHY